MVEVVDVTKVVVVVGSFVVVVVPVVVVAVVVVVSNVVVVVSTGPHQLHTTAALVSQAASFKRHVSRSIFLFRMPCTTHSSPCRSPAYQTLDGTLFPFSFW